MTLCCSRNSILVRIIIILGCGVDGDLINDRCKNHTLEPFLARELEKVGQSIADSWQSTIID